MNSVNDDFSEFLLFIFIILFIHMIAFYVSTSWDTDIKKGNKIKIGNAVYKCEKLQELELE